MERRLAAILAADVVGYSRLMGADEAGTLAALRDLTAAVIGPACSGNRGKVVKSLGDGWLMRFPSAVDAVNCAMQMQDRLAGHDRFSLRIGILAGDVVHEEDDKFGDAVNIAARLEAECEPGEVIVSDAAFISLDGTLTPSFDDTGERALKNIARPVRVWTRPRPQPPSQNSTESDSLPRLTIAPVHAAMAGRTGGCRHQFGNRLSPAIPPARAWQSDAAGGYAHRSEPRNAVVGEV